jgi:hypothetical protein
MKKILVEKILMENQHMAISDHKIRQEEALAVYYHPNIPFNGGGFNIASNSRWRCGFAHPMRPYFLSLISLHHFQSTYRGITTSPSCNDPQIL